MFHEPAKSFVKDSEVEFLSELETLSSLQSAFRNSVKEEVAYMVATLATVQCANRCVLHHMHRDVHADVQTLLHLFTFLRIFLFISFERYNTYF